MVFKYVPTVAHMSKVLVAQDQLGTNQAAIKFALTPKKVNEYRDTLETNIPLQEAYMERSAMIQYDPEERLRTLQAMAIEKAFEVVRDLDTESGDSLRSLMRLLDTVASVLPTKVRVNIEETKEVEPLEDDSTIPFTDHLKRMTLASH